VPRNPRAGMPRRLVLAPLGTPVMCVTSRDLAHRSLNEAKEACIITTARTGSSSVILSDLSLVFDKGLPSGKVNWLTILPCTYSLSRDLTAFSGDQVPNASTTLNLF
jgi:hypothetical protein